MSSAIKFWLKCIPYKFQSVLRNLFTCLFKRIWSNEDSLTKGILNEFYCWNCFSNQSLIKDCSCCKYIIFTFSMSSILRCIQILFALLIRFWFSSFNCFRSCLRSCCFFSTFWSSCLLFIWNLRFVKLCFFLFIFKDWRSIIWNRNIKI